MLQLEYDKDVENRVWRCRYRGPVLFHNSKRFDINYGSLLHHSLFEPVQKIINNKIIGSMGAYNQNHGHIVGAGILCDITEHPSSDWCIPGNWYWHFRDKFVFKKPIPCKGALKLFKPKIMKDDFQAIDYKKFCELSNISKKLGFTKV